MELSYVFFIYLNHIPKIVNKIVQIYGNISHLSAYRIYYLFMPDKGRITYSWKFPLSDSFGVINQNPYLHHNLSEVALYGHGNIMHRV